VAVLDEEIRARVIETGESLGAVEAGGRADARDCGDSVGG
jgi:hypothetical protein